MSKHKPKTEQEIKDRGPIWVGYAPRIEKGKRERQRDNERKEKQRKKDLEELEDEGIINSRIDS